MKRHDLPPGYTIEDAALKLVAEANERGEDIVSSINDVDVVVHPGDDPARIVNYYREKTETSRLPVEKKKKKKR